MFQNRNGSTKRRGEQDQIDEYAWDDVNDMELPIEKVREARTEEIKYMKGTTFKVVEKSEAYSLMSLAPRSASHTRSWQG